MTSKAMRHKITQILYNILNNNTLCTYLFIYIKTVVIIFFSFSSSKLYILNTLY